MVPTTITYFDVSPETVYDGKHGHMVKIAYTFQLDGTLMNSDIVSYFDFIEDIVFRMEWKRIISSTESVLIWERELPVYPAKRFMVTNGPNKRSARCFLPRDFLAVENGFPQRADLFCRISLIPLLSSTRRTVSYQPHGGYYVLNNATTGDAAEYSAGSEGQEY